MFKLLLTCFQIEPNSILKLSLWNTCNHLEFLYRTQLLRLYVFEFLEKHFKWKLIKLNSSFLDKSRECFFSISTLPKAVLKPECRLPKRLIILWNRMLKIGVFKFRIELLFIVSRLNKVKYNLQVVQYFRLAIRKVKFSKALKIHCQFLCSFFLLLCVKQFNKENIYPWSDRKALNQMRKMLNDCFIWVILFVKMTSEKCTTFAK